MKLGDFLTLKSVISFIYALGALLVPGLVIVFHGRTADDVTQIVARYYGAFLLAIGLICWNMRNVKATGAWRGVLLALLIADTLSLVVAVFAQISNIFGFLGWIDVAVLAVLVLGLGYFYLQPASE